MGTDYNLIFRILQQFEELAREGEAASLPDSVEFTLSQVDEHLKLCRQNGWIQYSRSYRVFELTTQGRAMLQALRAFSK